MSQYLHGLQDHGQILCIHPKPNVDWYTIFYAPTLEKLKGLLRWACPSEQILRDCFEIS